MLGAPYHCPGMMHHIVHCNRKCVFIPQLDITYRIPYQYHVYPGLVHQDRHTIIVGRQHGNLLIFCLFIPYCSSSNSSHNLIPLCNSFGSILHPH